MGFTSVVFLGFFALVLLLYRGLRSHRLQNLLLLAASYLFYASWDWRFLGLVVGLTGLDFGAALALERAGARWRRGLLTGTVVLNLLPLAFFKYWDFGVESLARLLQVVGLGGELSSLNVVLPVGISFFTFQSLSYVVDVHRGERRATRDLPSFALYIAYFPQLLAGPIERSTSLLPQLQRPRRRPDRELVRSALSWILTGYFLKVVLADTLAPMVDHVFENVGRSSGAVLLTAGYAFAIQIFCDFAGYSMIARGLSRLLGIELMRNFRQPYLARSIREVWSRWHVSLTTWLRDYVYIPLGGGRRGRGRKYVNVLVTMGLCGLWHGAAWPMVIFGLLHGGYLVVGDLLRRGARTAAWEARVPGVVQVLFVQLLWSLSLLVFRSQDVPQALEVLGRVFGDFAPGDELGLYLRPTLVAWLVVMAHHLGQEHGHERFAALRRSGFARACLASFLLLSTLAVGFQDQQFFYFQF